MAGEIEEPLGLDFRVDSFGSGSISFGRFEREALCWERRSSFSHNRYLEEVEQCSKPGSVTEKKAYFEAHFRKKGFPFPSSPGCRNETGYQTSENDTSETMCNDEELDHMNASTRSLHFDACLNGSLHGGDDQVTECETEVLRTTFSETQFGHATDGCNYVDCVPQRVNVEKADDAELGSSLSINSESGVEMKDNLEGETADLNTSHESNMAMGLSPDSSANEENSNPSTKDQECSSQKGKIPSKPEHIKPRLSPRASAGQSRRHTSGNTYKGSENNANNKVRNIPVRSKAEKKASEDHKKSLMQKTTKYEHGSKTKGVDETNSAQREPRSRTIVEPRSSTSLKVSSRAYQTANRVKPAVGVIKPGTRQDSSRSSFRSNEHAQRRKEFDMKLEPKLHEKKAEMRQIQSKTQEKTRAETKQMGKGLSFKAIHMPSYYRGALSVPDNNKAVPSNNEPRKQRAKSSVPGIRFPGATLTSARTKTADPPEASGVTSCHSTVTSDGSASSSAATSKDKPSQAGIRLTSRKKEAEREKLTTLRKHKVAECDQIHKGKIFDGNQETRIGRSTYASFNSSSRAGRMVVRVAS